MSDNVLTDELIVRMILIAIVNGPRPNTEANIARAVEGAKRIMEAASA